MSLWQKSDDVKTFQKVVKNQTEIWAKWEATKHFKSTFPVLTYRLGWEQSLSGYWHWPVKCVLYSSAFDQFSLSSRGLQIQHVLCTVYMCTTSNHRPTFDRQTRKMEIVLQKFEPSKQRISHNVNLETPAKFMRTTSCAPLDVKTNK